MMFASKCLTISACTSFTVFSALPALAQIPVTGGRLTGEAAFFRPASGNTVFFDLGPRTLRLETPNGVTVDSRFLPTAGQLEPIGNRLPTTGDRGVLDGLLSGRAFDRSGSPVFFSNVPTQLNFTLNSFVPSTGNLTGSLIQSNSAANSRIFVPVLDVRLDPTVASLFSVREGSLAAGFFDARLPGGTIGLPNTARFGTPLVNEFAVPDVVVTESRPFSFQFAGVGIPDQSSFFDPFFAGGVRFSSANATTNFTIQLDGTPLIITGSGVAGTIIEIQGITPASSARSFALPGTNPFDPRVGYSVLGKGSGTVTNSEPLLFSSGASATTFLFQDNFGNFAQGVSAGVTNFAIAGAAPFTASSFSNLIPTAGVNSVNISSGGIFVAAPVVPPPALVGSTRQNTTPGASGRSSGVVPPTVSPVFATQTIPPAVPANSQNFVITPTAAGPIIGIPDPSMPGVTIVVAAPASVINPPSITSGGAINISAINPAGGQATGLINNLMSPLASDGIINTGTVEQIQAFTARQNSQNASIGGLVNAEIAWNTTMTSIEKDEARIQTEIERRAAEMQAWRALNGLD